MNSDPLWAPVPLFGSCSTFFGTLFHKLWNCSTKSGTVPLCVGLLGYCPEFCCHIGNRRQEKANILRNSNHRIRKEMNYGKGSERNEFGLFLTFFIKCEGNYAPLFNISALKIIKGFAPKKWRCRYSYKESPPRRIKATLLPQCCKSQDVVLSLSEISLQ